MQIQLKIFIVPIQPCDCPRKWNEGKMNGEGKVSNELNESK